MTTKEILRDIADKLPDNATLADAAYELELRSAIVEGIEALDRGESLPIEEVEKMLPQWISK
jgi:predicted transcriptional regulator